MEIKKVELVHGNPEKTDIPNFVIHYKGTKQTSAFVSTEVLNRHYKEVREWYEAQDDKPFEFKFEA